MNAPSLATPEPGTLIAGKYRVDRVLASGGMGVVVEAEHAALGQRVAIKFLLPEAAKQPELVERFLREARAAARLQSDHVVRVFDIGKDERGVAFMVMELLAGVDLGDEIEARGPLPPGEAAGIVVEALEAIVEAHAAGIVHRDLKPSNLFLVSRPDGSRRVKVLDFGISKIADAGGGPVDAALTSTRSMLGSPGYMSPEQVRSTKSVDARTDVWALGVILYEMLSGAPAFQGETLGDLFAKIREEDLPGIRTLRPDVPEGLASVLAACLQRDREKRLPDAVTLRARLLPFAGRVGATTGPSVAIGRREAESAPTLAAPATSAPDGDASAADERRDAVEAPRLGGETLATWSGEHGGRRRGRLVIGGSLIALAAAAASVWLALRPLPPADATPAGAGSTSGAPSSLSTMAAPGAAKGAPGGVNGGPAVTPSEPAIPATAAASGGPEASASASKPPAPPHAGSGPQAPPPRPIVSPSPSTPPKKKKEDLGI